MDMQDNNGDFTAEGRTRQDNHLPVGNWVSLAVVLSWSAGIDREHFMTINPINIGIWWWCCCCCKMVLLPQNDVAENCCCLQTAATSCWCWELLALQVCWVCM
jgi:hypothetical protein